MSSHAIALTRSAALAAVFGAGMIAAPLTAVQAQTTPSHAAATPMAKHEAKADAHAETIDKRINMLHTQLKITPAEETDWQAVAQTMRDNVAAMQKIAADKASQTSMTAVEDLQTYEQFAQAHVDGLHKLVTSFQTLYNEMPASQQKLADQVFQQSRQHETARPS
jgi:hypothetical protein